MDIRTISLADTVGVSSVEKIASIVKPVMSEFAEQEIGVHLHSRPDVAAEKILAAYDSGCRRFDSAIGGLGGFPLAQEEFVGNIPTGRVPQAPSLPAAPPPPLNPHNFPINTSRLTSTHSHPTNT